MSVRITPDEHVGLNFKQLWSKSVPERTIDLWYETIRRHYGEPGRFYHTIEHISQGLYAFQGRTRRFVHHLNEVETAYILHDVIYDPRRSDNEELSAKFARLMLKKFGVAESFIANVEGDIMATKHDGRAVTPDQKLICDVDLLGFGEDFEIVAENSIKIRREYSWVPRGEYIEKRAAILQGFMARGVYLTPRFRSKYGAQAIENIGREIDSLDELTREADSHSA